MPFEIIKPGTNFDFMSLRWKFIGFSAAMILAGLVALVFMGLNLGIDFKGGTKLVLRFEGSEPVNRDRIREVIAAKIKEIRGADVQVEVQDFRAGSEDNEVRYMVYTESVSLITDEKKAELTEQLKKDFGESTSVSPPAEGSDLFFVTFHEEQNIAEAAAKLRDAFTRGGLERVEVTSDKVREREMRGFEVMGVRSKEAGKEELRDDTSTDRLEQEKAQLQTDLGEYMKVNTDTSFSVAIEEMKAKMEEAIMADADLKARFSVIETSTSISPSVGSDMLNTGMLAMVYACLGILLYIALRFDFRYGPGAVVALAHDAFITVGIFALVQVPFTLPIIAAILTVIGYSVNDTIVIFDRIRENVTKLKGLPMERIVNTSINETLSRTLLTSGTTLLVVLSIYILGGGLVKDFAFALLIGITVGTYSSIFIASPVVLGIDRWMHEKRQARA